MTAMTESDVPNVEMTEEPWPGEPIFWLDRNLESLAGENYLTLL